MRTRVKICGITRLEDALEQAARIIAALPPFVTTVALFVNADAETIAEVVSLARVDLLHHGNECPDYCARQGRPWIKAIRMKEGVDLEAEAERYSAASALLLDAYRPGPRRCARYGPGPWT